jgi:hypothetical protein
MMQSPALADAQVSGDLADLDVPHVVDPDVHFMRKAVKD